MRQDSGKIFSTSQSPFTLLSLWCSGKKMCQLAFWSPSSPLPLGSPHSILSLVPSLLSFDSTSSGFSSVWAPVLQGGPGPSNFLGPLEWQILPVSASVLKLAHHSLQWMAAGCWGVLLFSGLSIATPLHRSFLPHKYSCRPCGCVCVHNCLCFEVCSNTLSPSVWFCYLMALFLYLFHNLERLKNYAFAAISLEPMVLISYLISEILHLFTH